MQSMDSYQRVLKAVAMQKPDRPPLELLATDPVVENLRRHLGVADREELLRRLGVDFRRFDLEIDKRQPLPETLRQRIGAEDSIEVSPYGVVLLRHPNSPQGHRIYGPLYDTDDLDSFDWPTPEDVLHTTMVYTEVRRANQAGLATLTGCDNPFKIAYFMRRYEDFLIDCLERPEYASELLERIAAVEFTRAENGVRAGARCAMIFGDFAHQQELMVSPKVFRTVLLPVLQEFVLRLKAINPKVLVFLHSDGNLSSVLPDLIECGFAAVHPIQPESMDMAAVKREHGDRLTLFGGVSVQSELPRSDPLEIRRLVRRRIELLGRGGGLILAPTNTITEDVPLDSVVGMYEEARSGEQ
jgi:uroporphyrinogen decarboxylase